MTNITIQIFVKKAYGATYSYANSNYYGGAVTSSYTTNATYIIYTWIIVSGQTFTCSGGPYTFMAAFGGTGTAQVTSGDAYILTATTSGGVTNTLSGHF